MSHLKRLQNQCKHPTVPHACTQGVAPAYAEVLSAAGAGPATFAERLAASPAFTSFFLKRETAEGVAQDAAPTEAELKARGVVLILVLMIGSGGDW